MPADIDVTSSDRVEHDTDPAGGRYDRPTLFAFVGDRGSEQVLRDGLAKISSEQFEFRRGGIRAAIAAMQKQATPRILVVDVTGEEQPLSALGELATVVEPDVSVLVIGDVSNMDFYREVTRGMGAADYFAKPLTPDLVARHFVSFLEGKGPGQSIVGGRSIAITGVRGGTGATTIAVNLAWHLGVTLHHHTVLLDPDILMGNAALMLNLQPAPGLYTALEAPDRIDALLAERVAQPAAERLHVLAGEEPITSQPKLAPGAGEALHAALRKRYNFIIADVPSIPITLYRNLLDVVDQRVLVLEPSLTAVRDTLRLLALPAGHSQTQRPIVVLNRIGIPGGLTRQQVEDVLKRKVDVAIPDLPKQVSSAATLGEPAITSSSGFRTGILELARQVAFIGFLDSPAPAALHTGARGGFWSFLRGRS